MNELFVRKTIRLKDYDYSSAGYYFVTICVKDRQELLGKVVGTTARVSPSGDETGASHRGHPFVELTPIGQCVAETIQNANRGNVRIDKYVVMPNHIHMIVVLGSITDDLYAEHQFHVLSSLQQVVRNIKSFVTKWVGFPLWQPRFYDHIIRNEADYERIWQYIDENPALWNDDEYNTC